MVEKVKAAVSVSAGKVEIQEFPMPKLEKGAAIMKVHMCGICGTDKHAFKGEGTQGVGTDNEHAMPYPCIQGHEIVGEIAAIDEEGAKTLDYDGNILKVGDRVVICPDVTCGTCWYCKHIPDYPWCKELQFTYGCTKGCTEAPHLFGGFAEYMYVAPGSRLYKVPDDLPDELAVFTEVMCVTYALDKAKELYTWGGEGLGFGDTVVIQGCGPLGLAMVIKARMLGVGKIICTDISDYKLNLAKEFGADVLLNSAKTTSEERIARVLEETEGRGADVAVECVGRPFVIEEGLMMLRKSGMYLECGHFVDVGPTEMNMHLICSKSLRIFGMYNHSNAHYKQTMEMMARYKDKMPLHKYVTHIYSLAETEKAVYKSMEEETMKVVIDPRL